MKIIALYLKKTFLLVSLTCLALFAGYASFSQENTTAGENENIAGIVQDVLHQTNIFRKSEGLPELVDREDLNEIARKHSEDMASGRVDFGHDGFEQRNELARKKIKLLYNFAENVAYGVNSGGEAVAMWKKSSGHRRNMLGRYQYIGIGVAKNSKGQIFYTQIFAG